MKTVLFALPMIFLIGYGPKQVLWANDLPSTKDPAIDSETVAVKPQQAEVQLEKRSQAIDVSELMRECLSKNTNRRVCAANTMAECTKSMSKNDCSKAIRSARR